MNKKLPLVLLSVLCVMLLTNCTVAPQNEVDVYSQLTIGNSQEEGVSQSTDSDATKITPSCAQPSPEMAAHCQAIEEAILATTVRMELVRWMDKNGRQGDYIADCNSHATIKDGRYLVTHNHFGELLMALREEGVSGEHIHLALYKADGSLILSNIPLTDVSIAAEEAETLVLELKGEGSLGFFEMRKMPSAQFVDGQTLPLQRGLEVAQVDWDGVSTSFVRWTTIDSLIVNDDTLQMGLTSYVAQGASGGGVFWQGQHIGNNWFRTREQNRETGEVLAQSSIAALNSEVVTAIIIPLPNTPAIGLQSRDPLNDHSLPGNTEQISY